VDARLNDLHEQRLSSEDAIPAQSVKRFDEQKTVGRNEIMLDRFEEGPQSTFLGVPPTVGADTQIAEREREVEPEVVVSRIFLCH
jgi:hypothetical protein